MDNTIKNDLYRYAGKCDTATFIKKLIASPGFRFTYFFRKAAKNKKFSIAGLFYRFFYRRYTYKYGFQIALSTNIGKGLYIGHFGTLVVNEKAVIGDYCNLSPCVTIGQANRGKLKGCPTIGNKVWIGTGVVIVGLIKIGNNVLIAPNAYVNFDVPSNSIVIGNPGKIIAKESATMDYINNIL